MAEKIVNLKVFDEEGLVREDIVAEHGTDIAKILDSCNVIKFQLNKKRYLIGKNKKSLPGLEDGCELVYGTVLEKDIIENSSRKIYFHIEKEGSRFFIDEDGNHLVGYEDGLKYGRNLSINKDILIDNKTKKRNIFANGKFILDERAHRIEPVNRSYGEADIHAYYKQGDKEKVWYGSLIKREEPPKMKTQPRYDQIIKVGKNLCGVSDNTYTIADADITLEPNEKLLDAIVDRPLNADSCVVVFVVEHKGKRYLRKNNQGVIQNLGPKEGFEEYSHTDLKIQDRVGGPHLINGYHLLKLGDKRYVYNAAFEEATGGKLEGFDTFYYIMEITKEEWEPRQNKRHTSPYIFAKKDNKYYILPLIKSLHGYSYEVGKNHPLRENGFDEIQSIGDHNILGINEFSDNPFNLRPFVITNGNKAYLFDGKGNYVQDKIQGFEDGIDLSINTIEDMNGIDTFYIKQDTVCYYVYIGTSDTSPYAHISPAIECDRIVSPNYRAQEIEGIRILFLIEKEGKEYVYDGKTQECILRTEFEDKLTTDKEQYEKNKAQNKNKEILTTLLSGE